MQPLVLAKSSSGFPLSTRTLSPCGNSCSSSFSTGTSQNLGAARGEQLQCTSVMQPAWLLWRSLPQRLWSIFCFNTVFAPLQGYEIHLGYRHFPGSVSVKEKRLIYASKAAWWLAQKVKSSSNAPYLLLKLALILSKNKEVSFICCFAGSHMLRMGPEQHYEATSPLSFTAHLGSRQDQAPTLVETHQVFFTQVDLCYIIIPSRLLPFVPKT